jgi:CheY-like chemotaxis protein
LRRKSPNLFNRKKFFNASNSRKIDPLILEGTSSQLMPDYSALQILLVDDNPHMRAIVTAVLRGVGVTRFCEVSDGSEALKALRDFSADLAIVDFSMSPIDGVEFTRLIRLSDESPNPFLPILMMTGHAERARVVEARDSGVTEFIVKPITARAILDRIHAIVFKPRPFVRSADYFGPCRRRQTDPDYRGPFRRATDTGPHRETVMVE